MRSRRSFFRSHDLERKISTAGEYEWHEYHSFFLLYVACNEEEIAIVMPIELRHLRYSIAADQYRSFRQAAAALRLKQSTLSRRIHRLEDELGVLLFTRHTGGVRPTTAGQEFLRRAKRITDEVLTMFAAKDLKDWVPGVSDNEECGVGSTFGSGPPLHVYPDPKSGGNSGNRAYPFHDL